MDYHRSFDWKQDDVETVEQKGFTAGTLPSKGAGLNSDRVNQYLMHSHRKDCKVTAPKHLHMQTCGLWMAAWLENSACQLQAVDQFLLQRIVVFINIRKSLKILVASTSISGKFIIICVNLFLQLCPWNQPEIWRRETIWHLQNIPNFIKYEIGNRMLIKKPSFGEGVGMMISFLNGINKMISIGSSNIVKGKSLWCLKIGNWVGSIFGFWEGIDSIDLRRVFGVLCCLHTMILAIPWKAILPLVELRLHFVKYLQGFFLIISSSVLRGVFCKAKLFISPGFFCLILRLAWAPCTSFQYLNIRHPGKLNWPKLHITRPTRLKCVPVCNCYLYSSIFNINLAMSVFLTKSLYIQQYNQILSVFQLTPNRVCDSWILGSPRSRTYSKFPTFVIFDNSVANHPVLTERRLRSAGLLQRVKKIKRTEIWLARSTHRLFLQWLPFP
ncbi:hypothetical protein VP01_1800g3 [Puccinia sorghi]|uniref:Uncharacterized protein n=1 Tax=Puccinia sorghi TaxID=27349 RepID=A0A0L6VED5_9BASI|nr:hypothetical protein VP01_1800g3 [Puccinia sorghi]